MSDENAILCCGKGRTTSFCPDCGKLLRPDESLWGLLRHVEYTAVQTEKHAKEHLEWCEKHGELGRANKGQRAAAKWRSWAKLLRELLGQKNEEADE